MNDLELIDHIKQHTKLAPASADALVHRLSGHPDLRQQLVLWARGEKLDVTVNTDGVTLGRLIDERKLPVHQAVDVLLGLREDPKLVREYLRRGFDRVLPPR